MSIENFPFALMFKFPLSRSPKNLKFFPYDLTLNATLYVLTVKPFIQHWDLGKFILHSYDLGPFFSYAKDVVEKLFKIFLPFL